MAIQRGERVNLSNQYRNLYYYIGILNIGRHDAIDRVIHPHLAVYNVNVHSYIL